jgi:hypothetical protein
MPFPILPSNSASGYFLTKSLRFRGSASAQLTRTFPSAGNKKTWTWSAWVKRGSLPASVIHKIFTAESPPTYDPDGYIAFGGSSYQDCLRFQSYVGGVNASFVTAQVFRDPSAWYHIIVAVDTTQATSTNRVKIYVNGSQVTAFTVATYPSQNADLAFNGAYDHILGSAGYDFDGYLAEVNFINALQLAPTSFGSFNSLTGVWQPAKYTGAYSTNGFYLPFTNTTSTTTIGYDFSGNSNNFTSSNISLTAGTTYDSMTDVPTLTSATTANYAVMNPLSQSSNITLSGANLNTAGNTGADTGVAGSTFGLITGKWYVEYTVNGTNSNRPGIGIIANPTGNFRNGDADFSNAGSFEYYPNGALDVAGSSLGTFSSFTTNDIIGIAIDCDNGAAYVSKNNTWQNSGVPTSGASKTGAVVTWAPTSTYTQYVAISQYSSSSASTNFGQRAFSYTPPTNFNAVNTFNLPTSTIVKGNTVMDATLYNGNSSTQTINNASGFYPDFNWIKIRSGAGSHVLANSVVGGTKQLFSNLTNAEQTDTRITNGISSSGIALGDNSGGTGNTNISGTNYVVWQWNASSGTSVSNTAGSITSTVSANTTAGFSVVTYTGTGSAATVGHGLGVTPSMILLKCRTVGHDWRAFHGSFTSGNSYLRLNTTAATASSSTIWNGTLPTSSVFSVGTDGGTNESAATFVAYCFAQVAGYSAFGSYTGNGSSDGPFVYTGFRPRFVLIKCSSGAGTSWIIYDSSRNTYNATTSELYPNTSGAETNAYAIDFLSNGFKIRNGTTSNLNDSGSTQIYAAFAESPFKFALGR